MVIESDNHSTTLSRPRRILHVLSTPRAEGTPNLVLDWLAAETEYFQAVVILNSQPSDLTDQLRSAADEYEEHNLFSAGWRKYPGIARAVHQAVRKHRPDVLVFWPTGFANWGCLGAKLAGMRRMLVHCGNPPARSRRNDWMSLYGFWPLWFVGAKCICCSDYVRKELQHISWVPTRLFYTVWNCSRGVEVANAAKLGRSLRNGSAGRRAIMVATLERHKDHATLLRAVPEIAARLPDFELWIVGDGTLRGELESLISELKISDRVCLLGRRNDVGQLLGQADLFVLSTTVQEGLGSALIEALAAGLPVIATDVPACRELLCNGQYGKLVPSAAPTALAAQIIDTLSGPIPNVELGRRFALTLTPRQMVDSYLALADDTLSS